MSEDQLYSLISLYAQSGNLQAVVLHVVTRFPHYASDARKFLTAYDKYCKGKINRPGNGYVDVDAFKRACAVLAKGEDLKSGGRDD